MVIPEARPIARLWLVFFGDGSSAWARLLRPGFRHVSLAAWYASSERWVHVNPTMHGTVVEVMTADEFGGRFAQLLRDSSAILRVPGRYDRASMPAVGWCTGVVKAVLGVPCRALTPYGLYRGLIRSGAESVAVPSSVGPPIMQPSEGQPATETDDRQDQ